MEKPKNIEIRGNLARPLPIVADAAMAGPIADGRLIPLVIVDTSERQDIEELVRAHEHLPTGDVVGRWGQLVERKQKVALLLEFLRPAEVQLSLEFDIARQGGLVDQIIHAKAMYIQPGRPGDRLATKLENPRILIEVPESGFYETWDQLFRKGLVQDFKSRGLSRQQARKAAGEVIEDWRRFSRFRMPKKK